MRSRLAKIFEKSVLFQGGSDCKNSGDAAFAAICACGAATYWQTKEILFLKKKLPLLPVPAKTVLSSQTLFPLQTQLEMACQIAVNPVLIFGGGSVFFQPGGGVWRLCRMLSRMKKLYVGAVGVSLGPYASSQDRKSVQETLKHFSFLVLRDSASYQDAMDMNLPFKPVEGFDLAALLPNVYPFPTRPENRSRPVIGVSICHYERYVDGDLSIETQREQSLIQGLRLLAEQERVDFHIFVFNGNVKNGDREVSEYFESELKKTTKNQVLLIPYSNDPAEMWRQVAQCDAMVATRLHAGIFSYMAKVPFVQVEYHKKCTDFLDAIGYPNECRLGDFAVSSVELVDYMTRLLKMKKIIYEREQQELVKQAELNFCFDH